MPPVAGVFGFLKNVLEQAELRDAACDYISTDNAICSAALPRNPTPAVSIFTVRKYRQAEPLFSAVGSCTVVEEIRWIVTEIYIVTPLANDDRRLSISIYPVMLSGVYE